MSITSGERIRSKGRSARGIRTVEKWASLEREKDGKMRESEKKLEENEPTTHGLDSRIC